MISFADSVSPASRPDSPAREERAEKSRREAVYDAALVVRFGGGDEAAFIEIVGRHQVRLFSVAFSMLRNRGDAEEIAQDVFIHAHRCLGTFRGESSLATWLHHVALNLARNRYWYFHRRYRHATISLDYTVGEEGASTLLDLMECGTPSPPREAVTREFTELIAVGMARLEDRQRAILTLSHTLAYGEIARVLGINIGTVKSRIARARDNLRACLSAACPEFEAGARPMAWLEPVRHSEGLTLWRR